MDIISGAWKAIVAGLVAFTGAAATAAADDTITTGEWWTVAAATAAAMGAVYLVPNRQQEGDDLLDAEGYVGEHRA